MRRCVLCNNQGRIYCESDAAILCWDCDSIVHGANFLVARHLRIVLCHRCHSPTTRYGSGSKLPSTLFGSGNCICIKTSACGEEINNTDDDDEGGEGDSSTNSYEENQVVSWPVSIYATSEECFNSTQESASQSTTVVSVKVEPASPGYSGYSLSDEPTSLNAAASSKGIK